MSWRDKPTTSKQYELILEMNEFSVFPLPKFTGKTRGEASDYIKTNLSLAHELFDFNGHDDNYGDRI